MSVDLPSDLSARDLHRFSRLYEFPSWVKSASLDRLRGKGMSVTQYADPLHRRYPCGDRASTWMSALYFEEKRAELDSRSAALISERLEKMIDFWGVRGEVEQMRKRAAELREQSERELPDSHYAYVWVGDDGTKIRHYRLANAAEVKRAADYLCEHRGRFPYRVRQMMAQKILKRAQEENVKLAADVEGKLNRTAGNGEPDYGKIRVALGRRTMVVSNPDAKKTAQALHDIIQPSMHLSRDQLGKFVEALDDFDRRNLKPFSLDFPEDEIYATDGVEQKVAGEVCELVTGNRYDLADFEKLSADDLRAVLGDDFVSEVQDGLEISPVKVAEVARTLPRGDAELFERLLASVGVRPRN